MFKVLIVDDDNMVRTKIKLLLEKHRDEYFICGEAVDGKEALQLIAEAAPHIVLSDVCMPGISGVELAEQIQARFKDTVLVVFSNYDDFDYVRGTLKNGALDYILKHKLDEENLIGILKRATDIVLTKNCRPDQSVTRQANLAVHSQKFVKELISGILENEVDLSKEMELLGVKLDTKNIQPVIMEIDHYKKIAEQNDLKTWTLKELTIINLVRKILNEYGNGVVCQLSEYRFLILVSPESRLRNWQQDNHEINEIAPLLKRINASIKSTVNHTVTFGCGGICPEISLIPENYKQAELAIRNKFHAGGSNIFSGVQQSEPTDFLYMDIATEKELLHYLEMGNEAALIERLNGIFHGIKNQSIPYSSYQIFFNDCLSLMNKISVKNNISLEKIFSERKNPQHILDQFETLTEIKGWFIEKYLLLLSVIQEKTYDSHSKIIADVIQYIKKHYLQDIHETTVAEFFKINRSYLSKLFKEEVGVGFNEYLNNLRIEKVKELLLDGHTNLKEIISQCGFQSYHYFFNYFKKKTGLTPKEFVSRKDK